MLLPFFLAFSLISLVNSSACPRGYSFYNGNGLCYRVISTPLNWQVAQMACTQTGGILATVPNLYSNLWVMNLTATSAPCSTDYWIGLNSYYTEIKDWSWLDGSTSTYRNWLPGKPEKKHEQWPVVRMVGGTDGRWVDSQSDWSYCPICSAYPNTTIQVCESGWTYYAPTYSCYKNFVSETQDHAENFCKLAGAHLTSIHSADENDFLINLVQTGLQAVPASQQVWIGLTRVGGNWINLDGSPVDYTNFGTGYPRSSNGTNNCAILFADPDPTGFVSFWQDTTCIQNQRAYVCKTPANI